MSISWLIRILQANLCQGIQPPYLALTQGWLGVEILNGLMVGDHMCDPTIQIGSPPPHRGNNGEQLTLVGGIIWLCTGQLTTVELYQSQISTLILTQNSAKCVCGRVSLDDKIMGEIGQYQNLVTTYSLPQSIKARLLGCSPAPMRILAQQVRWWGGFCRIILHKLCIVIGKSKENLHIMSTCRCWPLLYSRNLPQMWLYPIC